MSKLLSKRYRPDELRGVYSLSKEDYKLSCPIDDDWDDKPQRVLVVLETIDGQDLKEGRLLHERSHTVVTSLLQYSMIQAKKEFGFKRKECAFATVNYNEYKFFDQPVETWAGHRRKMMARIRKVILALKPTHIVVFGDRAMKTLLPNEDVLEKKRGRTFDFKVDDWKCKISGSLDLQPLYSTQKEDANANDDDNEEGDVYGKANLLFYVSRLLVNSLAGRLLYDLSHIKPNVKYLDTIGKFKKFYAKLLEAKVVAVDTETRNGSVNHNAIHTIQFSFSEDRSYFLPVDHPETPFSKKERAYIKSKLRAFFYAKPGELPTKYLIMQYGTFDLRILRVELGIPLIFHPVWEIQAGLWCFHPETLVETELGRMQIQELVNRPDVRVWSYDHVTGERVLKPTFGGVHRQTNEDLIEIVHEHGTLRVTADHKIWSNTRDAYVKAGEIEEGEDLELFADSPPCEDAAAQ